jgi:hypothetical protein
MMLKTADAGSMDSLIARHHLTRRRGAYGLTVGFCYVGTVIFDG